MTEKNKGAMDEAKGLVKEKAKHLTKEAAGAVVGNQELAKGLAKEATGAATGDEELKLKGVRSGRRAHKVLKKTWDAS